MRKARRTASPRLTFHFRAALSTARRSAKVKRSKIGFAFLTVP
jgi:hypothetical protein